MQVILSTVGTSLFGKAGLEGRIVQALRGVPVAQKDTVKEYYQKAYQALLRFSEKPDFKLRRDCAETNCLSRLQVMDIDHLIFLTTDTLDGLVTGEAVAEICRREWKCQVEVVHVPGLQVKDSSKFRLEGLAHFVHTVDHYIKKYKKGINEIILNATGGFKATLTYLTLLGQLEGLPVCYINEDYNSLIYLPAAPLQYDPQPLEELLALMDEKKIIALYQGASHRELSEWTDLSITQLKQQFRQILVWEKEKVYLSVLAQIVFDRDVRKQKKPVHPLSRLRIDDQI